MRAFVLSGLLGTLLQAGCSSSPAGADAAASGDATTTQDAATSGDAGSDAPAGLQAPTIVKVEPMAGGLHVTWTNGQKDCDAIEGERKSDADAYKLVFTVPDGSVDNKHDGPLTAGKVYTYRVRCKKGSDYSTYSNEQSGTP